jgi:hypothetical protein
MQWVSDRLAVLKEAGAIVSFGQVSFNNQDVEPGKIAKIAKEGVDANIRSWGRRNNMPQIREDLVNSNNIVGSLISTKRDILLGAGLMAYRERYVDGKRQVEEIEMPAAIKDWMERIEIEKWLRSSCKELLLHGNVFTEMTRDKGGRIFSIKNLRAAYIRAQEKREDDTIPAWWWSPGWALKTSEQKTAIVRGIPAYDKNARQPLFVMHTYDDVCRTDDYYYAPTWWGGWQWIDLANAIPHFHRSNLQHGYSIRYHIEIPSDYFDDNVPEVLTDQKVSDAETRRAQAKEDFLNGLNDFLAGVKNSGRTVVTEYEINKHLGKEYSGIKITPLKVDLQDKALLDLFESSNKANISAQAIHPTLAAVETSGRLSSGSEIRNALTMFVAIKAPTTRSILLEPLHLVAKANGWGDIKFGFRDIQITTMDESKTGTTEGAPITA